MKKGSGVAPARTPGVYAIMCSKDPRVYIGSAVCLLRRWNQHRHYLRAGTHHCAPLQAAWKLLGETSFSFIPLVTGVLTDRRAVENVWLLAVRDLFNRATDARDNRGVRFSEEARARMSAAQKGRSVSPEHRERIAASLRGRTRSPEATAKQRAKMLGRSFSKAHKAALQAAADKRAMLLEAFGKRQSLRAWTEEVGIPKSTLFNRINRGVPLETALTMERRPNGS